MKFADLLNRATKAGTIAKKNRLSPTQISNLLSVLESERGYDGILLLQAFIARQSKRGRNPPIQPAVAKQLIEDIQAICNEETNDERRVELVKKYLGLIKWVNEASPDNVNVVNTFNSFIQVYLRNLPTSRR